MEIKKVFASLSDVERKLLYLSNVKPILNKRALFSDATETYRNPRQPGVNEDMTIRIRTARYNVDEVVLVADGVRYEMEKKESDIQFDYYETVINAGDHPFDYYFEVTCGKTVCGYNKQGAQKYIDPVYNFDVKPGFITPEWVRGAVMYQIYVDRFCNGDETNDVLDHEYSYINGHTVKVANWDEYPAMMDVRSFHGGDLQGVLQKLDYLQDLGVEVIYFNPLFVSPSNHKYDIQDYDYIDPHFGVIIEDEGELLEPNDNDNTHATRYIKRVTSRKNLEASNELFAKVVEEIHRRGMKVIIDGVFNHCGSFNKWMDKEHIYENSSDNYEKGAITGTDSIYRKFFDFNADGTYDGWWGHDTLPKLNYENSEELEDYILHIAAKWVSPPYNCDGWRLDVAADLGHSKEYNHLFWQKFRNAVKTANPEAVILAENYGDSHEWLLGNEWDTIMNYDAFMEPVTWFLTGMEKHSDACEGDKIGRQDYFFGAMNYNMARMGSQPVEISMNELSNHDHSRFLTRTNRQVGRLNTKGPIAAEQGVRKAVFKEAVVMQMTWPGAPTIYYGDEAGVCGWTDPDNRRVYPWGREDKELIEFHKAVIQMHKENIALRKGSYKQLMSDYNLISYGRFYQDNIIIVIVNNSDDERRVKIPVWELGLTEKDDLEQIMQTEENDFSTSRLGYSLMDGLLDIGLRACSAVVLRKILY